MKQVKLSDQRRAFEK